jgi:hypothetical protein
MSGSRIHLVEMYLILVSSLCPAGDVIIGVQLVFWGVEIRGNLIMPH